MVEKISEELGVNVAGCLESKYYRGNSDIRAFTTYVIRVLCGFTLKDICQYIGNITLSGVKRLANRGYELFACDVKYRQAFSAITGL